MSALIELREATRTYNERAVRPALDRVTLEISAGEFTAIMGPSGSGKSTILNLIAGLDRPSSGSVVVDGMNLAEMGETALARFRRRRIGFVFQFFNLLPNLTSLENVLMPAKLSGGSHSEAKARARQLLERLGISDTADRYPARLSGGEQQRVAIARALVNRPTVLLADEPTGALDTRSGSEVMELLGEFHREGQTILLVTHDPKLATLHTGRVVSLVDGQVVDDSSLSRSDVPPGQLVRFGLEQPSQ